MNKELIFLFFSFFLPSFDSEINSTRCDRARKLVACANVCSRTRMFCLDRQRCERHVVARRNTNNHYFTMLTRCDFQFSLRRSSLAAVKVLQVIERISWKALPQVGHSLTSRHSSMFMQSPTIKRNVIVRAANCAQETQRRLASTSSAEPRESSRESGTREMHDKTSDKRNTLPFLDYETLQLVSLILSFFCSFW